MNNFFLSLDLEEWYHLEYFNQYNPDKTPIMISKLTPFFNLLDKYNIKITVFVLGELIKEHRNLIKNISKRGHEIAIHGWNHDLLHEKSEQSFTQEISETKKELEAIINKPVIGYRAPCFSLDNKKLRVLKDIGLKYDSSYIKFKEHPLYGQLSMEGFEQKEDLIYSKENFYEFELPTLNIFGKNIPISGGGYFRFFPKLIFNFMWKKYLKKHSNYVMYIHPFELTNAKVNLKGYALKDKIRFSIGRKNNLKKLEWFTEKCLESNYYFVTMSEYIKK